jgi:hypothetical protein
MKLKALSAALLVSTAAVLNLGSARATTYDFSYQFNTGDVISGSFTGDLSGGSITDLSNIKAELDGVPLEGSGSLFAYSWSASAGNWIGSGAVASFSPYGNNFAFTDASAVLTDNKLTAGTANYFYIIPYPSGTSSNATQYYSPSVGFIDYYNGAYTGT